MSFSIAYDGAFAFDAVLTIETGEEHSGKYANLYYYNPETGKLELVDSVPVDEAGEARFNMKHASDYAVTFTDKQMIVSNSRNTMLYVILGIIIAGGLSVLGYVIYRVKTGSDEEDDYFYD
jgi:hypothetical protein